MAIFRRVRCETDPLFFQMWQVKEKVTKQQKKLATKQFRRELRRAIDQIKEELVESGLVTLELIQDEVTRQVGLVNIDW